MCACVVAPVGGYVVPSEFSAWTVLASYQLFFASLFGFELQRANASTLADRDPSKNKVPSPWPPWPPIFDSLYSTVGSDTA